MNRLLRWLAGLSLGAFCITMIALVASGLTIRQRIKESKPQGGEVGATYLGGLLGDSQAQATILTSAVVATHNTSSNCWLIISESVYDVSSYLVQHPGGVGVVTPYCGKEATNAFQTRGGSGSHSTGAYKALSQYYIGLVGGTTTTTPTPSPLSTGSGTTGSGSGTSASLPAAVSSKYPNASVNESHYEDNGSWEGKIYSNGQCREIKVNSSGTITSDHSC